MLLPLGDFCHDFVLLSNFVVFMRPKQRTISANPLLICDADDFQRSIVSLAVLFARIFIRKYSFPLSSFLKFLVRGRRIYSIALFHLGYLHLVSNGLVLGIRTDTIVYYFLLRLDVLVKYVFAAKYQWLMVLTYCTLVPECRLKFVILYLLQHLH